MQDLSPDQLKEKLDNGDSIFLKLWKPGCGACTLSKPAIERLEASKAYDLEFVQIDAAAHPEILEIADTEILPVFFVFVNKQMKGKHIGFKGLAKLKGFLEEQL